MKEYQIVTPEEMEELARLNIEYPRAQSEALVIAALEGMGSPNFVRADKRVGVLLRRIKEIRGTPGQHWMA